MSVGPASVTAPARARSLRWLTSIALLFAAVAAQPALAATFRINAGGTSYVDAASNTWAADNSFNASSTVNWGAVAISGTSDPTLYRTERYATNLQYTLAVPNDTYTVKLYFAENYVNSTFPNGGVGFRVFSVQANGTTIVPNLDVFATAGARTAVVKTATVNVTTSQIVLSFSNGGFVNAIELIGQNAGIDTTPPSVPTGITAVGQTTSSIKVSWNASTDNAGGAGLGGYKVFRNGGATAVGNVTSGTTFTDTGLAPNTTYTYTVSAYDLATPSNESVPSTGAQGATLAPTSGNVYQCNDAGASGRLVIDQNTIGRTPNFPNCTNMVSVPLANAGVTLQRWHPTDQTDPFAVWQSINNLPSGWFLWTPSGWQTLAQVQSGGGSGDTTPPTVPGSPSAVAQSSSTILVSWTASTDASGVAGYIVRRNGTALPITGSTSFLDTGRAANTTYSYTISAVDNASPANESAQSAAVSARTLVAADTTPPSVPTNVNASAQSSSSISLTWSAATDNTGGTGVGGYRIYRNGSTTPLTSVTGTSFTDTGLTASTTYSYTVSAFDLASPANESAKSTGASATTQAAGGGGTGQVYQCNDAGAQGRVAIGTNSLGLTANTPNCTAMVAVSYTGAGLVLMRWHPTDLADPYAIWQPIGSLPSGWYLWTPSGWQTLAQVQGGGGGGGDTTPPSVPGGLNATAVSSTQVNLTWNASTDNSGGAGLAGYKVYRNNAFVTNTSTTSYSDTGRSPSTTYTYTVSAYDLASPSNESAQSSAATATTQASGGSSGQVYQCNDAGAAGRLAVDQNSLGKTVNFPNCTNMIAIDYNSATLTLQRWHPGDPQDPDAFWQAPNILPQGWAMWTPGGWQTLAQLAGLTIVDIVPPTVPTGLTAQATSTSAIQLTWNPSTDATTTVRGYRVYRNGTLVGTPTYPNYLDSGLAAGTTYSYAVSALDMATPPNESAQSGGVSGTTFSGGGGGGGGGSGGWAWMGGPQKGGTWAFNGQYGFKGVASSSNYPGSRFQNMGWKDPSGNLWMMGGYGTDANGNYGRMDDIWKFDVGTNQWTWVAGQNFAQVNPVFGSQGSPSTGNTPGGRSASAVWSNGTDAYVFGGIWVNGFYELMNDLWKYNMNTGEWTWLKGSTTSNVGGNCSGYGVANGSNTPGARKGAAFWNDGAGNLWLFGGIGYDCGGTQNVMNDVWKYNIGSNTWTLVTGSTNGTPGGNFGSQGVAGGTPGGRQEPQFWRDNSGNLWVFGGLNAAGNQLNDLWKYNIGSNQWTWMGGSTNVNATGSYGSFGVASGGTPGARRGGAGSFDGTYAWVFGGFGWDAFGNKENLNDLWRYDPSNGQWTWMAGSNAVGSLGNYGSLGQSSTANSPPARNDFAFWTDNNGRFWVGQGEGQLSSTNHLADLFRY